MFQTKTICSMSPGFPRAAGHCQALRELCACVARSELCQEQDSKGPKTHGTVMAMGLPGCGHGQAPAPGSPLIGQNIQHGQEEKDSVLGDHHHTAMQAGHPPCSVGQPMLSMHR